MLVDAVLGIIILFIAGIGCILFLTAVLLALALAFIVDIYTNTKEMIMEMVEEFKK